MSTIATKAPPARGSLLYDPKVRGIAYQVVLGLLIALLIWSATSNVINNLRAAKLTPGFDFLRATSGFDVNQTLIPYSATSTYGRAFWVGLLNTLLVAAVGIVFSTIFGFLVGIARLSSNWVVAKAAMAYVEIIRNTPLLLQLLIWYIAVLRTLPDARNSLSIGGTLFLNNRGLFLPRPVSDGESWLVLAALVVGVVAAGWYFRKARREQTRTGRQSPVLRTSLALVLGLPILVWVLVALVHANPIGFDLPKQTRFNLNGGLQVYPEFVALSLGLVTYTAGFIAEVVRAGILAVSRGQTEAAHALGLRSGPTLRLVVVPQALRVIIPPLTSQYLNVTKNSSLAVVVGYPDLVQVFMGTVLNQTGQAVECVAITMAVYLLISLVTSVVMNDYNRRKALVER